MTTVGFIRCHIPWTIFKARLLRRTSSDGAENGGKRWNRLVESFPKTYHLTLSLANLLLRRVIESFGKSVQGVCYLTSCNLRYVPPLPSRAPPLCAQSTTVGTPGS
ncbi:unnamed protein product [Ectocarpus sp. 8 AP-2014]